MKEINKKLIKKSFCFAFLILIFSYLFFTFISYTKLFYSAKKIDSFNNKEFLRIKIYGSSSLPDGNTISGTFSIIDSKGSEIAVIERSWQGSYLAVEFLTVNIFNKSFSFPSSIYGKEKILDDKKSKKNGTSLEKYYNENGKCFLISSRKLQRALYNISIFAQEKIPLVDFGIIKKNTIDLSNCEFNKYYSITQDSRGNFILQEL